MPGRAGPGLATLYATPPCHLAFNFRHRTAFRLHRLGVDNGGMIHRKVDAAIVLAALGAVALVAGAWMQSAATGLLVSGGAVMVIGVAIHFWNRMCDEQEAAVRAAQQNPNSRE